MTITELARRNFEISTIALGTPEMRVQSEGVTQEGYTVYPGMMVLPTGTAVIPNPSAAETRAPILLALEQGEIGKTVHDAYDDGDFVNVLIPKKGDIVAVRVADDVTVSGGDILVMNGDGTVRPVESGEDDLYGLFIAMGDCDTTDSDTIALVAAIVL